MHWQLQEAKNKLSQVVHEAHESGPQIITVHGKESAVVMTVEDYRRLCARQENLADFLLHSPLRGSGLEIERFQGLGRDATF
jgi:prevent-host-death family protein